MKNRLPMALAVTALIIAVLGATGIAQASTVSFALNAGRLLGFKPSKTSRKNTVVVRGTNGKIDPASIPAQARGARGVTGPAGPVGPAGAQGIQGTQGIQGIQGPPGLSGYVGGSGGTSTVSVAPGTEGSATTFCPAGTQVLFGGFFSQTSPSSLRAVTSSLFISDAGLPGWEVTMTNEGATAQSFHVLVRCAHVS